VKIFLFLNCRHPELELSKPISSIDVTILKKEFGRKENHQNIKGKNIVK